VNNIKSCGSTGAPVCSGTDIGAGLEGAVNVALNSSSGAGVAKAIVMVTDGQPEPSPNGSHPGYTVTQMKALATQWADNADAAGISVFVVFYDGDNNAQAKAFLETLVRGDGIFLSTPDPTKLADLLGGICGKLITLQLVD
jgi:Mg-chelatase subunit ChlD